MVARPSHSSIESERRRERSYRWTRVAVICGFVFVAVGVGVLGWVTAARAASAIPTLADDVQVARDYWGWQRSLWCSSETFEESTVPLFVAGQTHFTGIDTRFPEGTEEVPCEVVVKNIADIEEMLRLNLPNDPYPVAVRAREVRCRIVVHEYGHVLHLDHDGDEASPMFWTFNFKAVEPCCEARLHEDAGLAPRPRRHRRQPHHGRRFMVGSSL